MENNQIKIIFNETNIIILESDRPNFPDIINAVVKEKYDISQLKVECDNDKFDAESFEIALKEVTSNIQEKFELRMNYCKKQLKKQKKKIKLMVNN